MKRMPGLIVLVLAATAVSATSQDRWLHLKVDNARPRGEIVRVNVPLSLAEKVLPIIKAENFRHGRIRVHGDMEGVDARALLEAVRTTSDGEFVTVQSARENVRVAKQNGYLLVKVREDKNGAATVDIKLPLTVVEALLSGEKDELNVAAAIRALSAHGDTELVSVNDNSQTVRIWVDSRNTQDTAGN